MKKKFEHYLKVYHDKILAPCPRRSMAITDLGFLIFLSPLFATILSRPLVLKIVSYIFSNGEVRVDPNFENEFSLILIGSFFISNLSLFLFHLLIHRYCLAQKETALKYYRFFYTFAAYSLPILFLLGILSLHWGAILCPPLFLHYCALRLFFKSRD